MTELAAIIVLGITAQWVAWKTRVPAILPLILTGLFVGPLADLIWGAKLIEPVFEYLTNPDGTFKLDENGQPISNGGLFHGKIMYHFVSLSIGVILFEGGLTLRKKELKGVSTAIMRLISVGSLITFIGGGIAAMIVTDLSAELAFLFAALIVVTGPTVIVPILQNVPLSRNVSTVLKWEGILIDPIGALISVLVYEFITSGQSSGAFTLTALGEFGSIVVIGVSMGVSTAYGFYLCLKHNVIPHYLLNVFTLALVLGVFVISDSMAHESGLLTVVVMGTVLANLKVPHLNDILSFKESLTVLLISVLFILLSANMEVDQIEKVLDWPYLILFGIIVLVLRPLGVFISSVGAELNLREKLFISWVGPRGIVAAGIASLFGLRLMEQGIPNADLITPMVFMIVLGTVVLNATTARLMARILGVTQDSSNGVLFVGANEGARLIAKYLQDNGRHVVLTDKNAMLVAEAEDMGLEAFVEDIFSEDLGERYELLDVGYLMALTGSVQVNRTACRKLRKNFGENGTFRLISRQEIKNGAEISDEMLFNACTDYINFIETARDYPEVHEMPIRSKEHLDRLCNEMYRNSIPLFLKRQDGELHILRATGADSEVKEGDQLVYMGKPIKEDMPKAFQTEENA